ncbi:MAG: hypothetical protein AB8C46_05170 [Burkholderiaceae bacterium]
MQAGLLDEATGLAGRFCPPDYRVKPEIFAGPAELAADILYVVGGLYGNPYALDVIEALIQAERRLNPGATCEIVFNGDFHWFDASPSLFRTLEQRSSAYYRQRGNVETEMARLDDDAAGCGCAYPESVSDQEVQWSNSIMASLIYAGRKGVGDAQIASLMNLPMASHWQIGDLRVAVTHGDHESLAGWGLAQDQLVNTWSQGLRTFMQTHELNLIASSHTCLPVADWPLMREDLAVINNGSAGMANSRGSTAGIISRIAANGSAPAPVKPLYSAKMRGTEIAALPVRFNFDAWLATFSEIWPEKSPADASYMKRICSGPDYCLSQAARGGFKRR